MHVVRAGFLYFAIVFAFRFVLGTLRVLWIAPRLGARFAELLEIPITLLVMYFAARWLVRRGTFPQGYLVRFSAGVLALSLMIAAELILIAGIRGLTIREYFASRDPVSFTAYLVSLLIFPYVPLLIHQRNTFS